jgi:hypothetical protein
VLICKNANGSMLEVDENFDNTVVLAWSSAGVCNQGFTDSFLGSFDVNLSGDDKKMVKPGSIH